MIKPKVSNCQKLGLLLWKNWMLQRRHKIRTAVEILLPVLFCGLLLLFRSIIENTKYEENTVYEPFSVDTLPPQLMNAGLVDALKLLPMDLALQLQKGRSDSDDMMDGGGMTGLAGMGAIGDILGDSITFLFKFVINAALDEVQYGISPFPFLPSMSMYNNLTTAMNDMKNSTLNDIRRKLSQKWHIAFTPNTTNIRKVMQNVVDKLDITALSFDTTEDLLKVVESPSYELDNTTYLSQEVILGAVIFEEDLPDAATAKPNIKYTIRLPGNQRVGNSNGAGAGRLDRWFTELAFPLFQRVEPRENEDQYGGRPGYYKEGFLSIQRRIDAAIVDLYATEPLFLNKEEDLTMQRLLFPPYVEDVFLLALGFQLPFLLLLSFMYPAVNIVSSIVHEKEKRLKESMKMMGLNNWLHWFAWFIKSFSFLTITVIIITIVLKIPMGDDSLAVLNKSDGSLILVFLLAYVFAAICFCFLLSTLFNKATTAAMVTGFAWFFTSAIVPQNYEEINSMTKVILCFYCNGALYMGATIIPMYEGTGSGIQWNLLFTPSTSDDTLTMGQILLQLLYDALACLVGTWYIESVWPGEYGTPLPWNFPFKISYWTGAQEDDEFDNFKVPPKPLDKQSFFEEEPNGMIGISIRGLTKEFDRGKKVAVNNMYLNMYSGQITALLGHNGAGKSTTMSVLTGLFPPTRGTASVGGHDIVKDMVQVRQSIGLCPQHNVLFDELTVREHIYFFGKLKGLEDDNIDEEVKSLVKSLKLEDKTDAQSKSLSGGMKRKLSVGIALCGGSKVVILDEPTSGMDPGARRVIWDLLQKERSTRTMLLTTHFMEEADLLGDRIAIMANGNIVCCGSSLFLKKKYGAGYNLIVVKNSNCNEVAVTSLIKEHVADAELSSNIAAELSYVLPNEQVSGFSKLFRILEEDQVKLGISSFGVSQTTMDEVFLRVGEEVESELHNNRRSDISTGHSDRSEVVMTDIVTDSTTIVPVTPPVTNRRDHRISTPVKERNIGCNLLIQQMWAMFVKKALFSIRNKIITVAQIISPLVLTIMEIYRPKASAGSADDVAREINMDAYTDTLTTVSLANKNDWADAVWKGFDSQKMSTNQFNSIGPDEDLNATLSEEASSNVYEFIQRRMAAYVLDTNLTENTVRVIFNNQPYHMAPMALQMADLAILRASTGVDDIDITVTNHPLPKMGVDSIVMGLSNLGGAVGSSLIFSTGFLFASFLLHIVKERSTNAKHLQFVSGVNFAVYWCASAVWDFITSIIVWVLIIIVLAIWGEDGFSNSEELSRVMLVLVLYSWSMLPLMYICSFLFNVPSTGFVRMAMANSFLGLTAYVAVSVLMIRDLDLVDLANILDWIFMLFPSYCMGMSLNMLHSNYFILDVCSDDFVKLCDVRPNPCCKDDCGEFGCEDYNKDYLGWEKKGIGRYLVFMAMEGFLFYLTIALIELRVFNRIKNFISSMVSSTPENVSLLDELEESVVEERKRITNTSNDTLFKTDYLVFRGLSKKYKKGPLAVNNLYLGVPHGECFGLLGINGAGKTTTFKMLTGDIDISSGDAYVSSYSISKNLKEAQRDIGYCPQFDAILDKLTGRETLRLFGRLRGVPEYALEQEIDLLGDQLLVSTHFDKPVINYSGGNMRKISTGIALIGGPPLILLDEPTSGMDPVARRHLWDVLNTVRRNGKSIILTSHSMEECEALCTRLAIMTNGTFRCLGSAQHLKSKFGEGYTVIAIIRVSEDQHGAALDMTEAPPEMVKVHAFFRQTFINCKLRDQQWGRVEYFVPSVGLSWGEVFEIMEQNVEELGITDYSVTQTTLERVFLNFTKDQRPEKND